MGPESSREGEPIRSAVQEVTPLSQGVPQEGRGAESVRKSWHSSEVGHGLAVGKRQMGRQKTRTGVGDLQTASLYCAVRPRIPEQTALCTASVQHTGVQCRGVEGSDPILQNRLRYAQPVCNTQVRCAVGSAGLRPL